MTDTAGRVYGGRSEAERRADRRDRLVEAGLELFGTSGWTNVTIEQLCAAASVATRSFYEEFPGRESLIQAVYDEVVRSASEAVVAALATSDCSLAGQIAAGVGAYIDHVTEDPVRRRVRTLALAGALSEVLVDWVAAPGPPSSLVPLREELVRLFTVALVTARQAPEARVRP